jgi:2'-5' RNA ligase
VRCFVAVDVPAEVRARLTAVTERLRRATPRADVRWSGADTMHVTLKFLGEVEDARIVDVTGALAMVAAAQRPLALGARGLGGFPSNSRPRIVWAGLTGQVERLGALAQAVDRALAGLGFPPEQRPFQGHLTIGRVRSPRGAERLAAVLRAEAETSFGAWTVDELVLYRSLLRPTGAVHEARARLALGPGGARDP